MCGHIISMFPLLFPGNACSASTSYAPRHDDHCALTQTRPCSVGGNESRPQKKGRIITEARKEQNRVAQKAFRQRQKEKRQQLKGRQTKQTSITSIRPRLGAKGTPAANADSLGRVNASPATSSSAAPVAAQSGEDLLGFKLGTFINVKPLTAVSLRHEESSGFLAPAPASWGQDMVGLREEPLFPASDDWNYRPDQESSDDSTPSSWDEAQPVFQANPALADPLCNTLEFLPTTIFGACLHNAAALGWDVEQLATCSPHGISPFYRPTTPETNPQTLLASLIINLPGQTPPHLRPTLTQVLVPHHPSLDLIPLPHLRDRAIMLSAALPTVFNLWELKLDIYAKGGLVMLKTTRGKDHRQRTCQPWDKSSWIAERWFLRKWTMLVDEELLSLGRTEGRVTDAVE